MSTPGIVMYYLIRKYPSYLCRLQNDAIGGPPDQIFFSMNISWQNGLKTLCDNKELIPEFFYETQFMKNIDEVDLGTDHLGEKVNDVELPPWATSVRDFIFKQNWALENADIAPWIDLVFGLNQRGPHAHQSLNLYQSHVYTSENLK